MKKRIKAKAFAVVLGMALAAGTFVIPGYTAEADSDYHGTLTVTADKTEAGAGDEISVTVELTENTGFITFLASLDYDPDVLTLTDFSYGDTFSGWVAPESSILTGSKMYWHIPYGDDTSTGLLATMTFTVNEDANYEVTEAGLDVESCYDTDFNELQIEQTKVKITISCSHVWDEGTVTREATYTQEGEKTFTCTKCGETHTETIPMLTGGTDALMARRGDKLYQQYSISSSVADAALTAAVSADSILFGDWDGDGIDEICLRVGNTYSFYSDSLAQELYAVVYYGRSTDDVFSGDWDGDGKDTLCVRRSGNRYYFQQSLSDTTAYESAVYGRSTDEALSGDWNGDGKDTLCIRRNGNHYYFQQYLADTTHFQMTTYGRSTDEALSGDWDGTGADTLCVRRGNSFYFQENLTDTNAYAQIYYGRSTDEIYAGRWN